MFRFFIIALLFWLIIWLVRGYGTGREEPETQELVRDAATGVYFPKKEALTVVRGGETLYFQNVENRDRYLTMNR
ncbi:MAG: hypothetical protein LBV79_11250 [Candidatus Adiutrix sp.]|jgi:hypothetical protein|nr:hypothetical protein [Candidatus Adiutrix sp.]